MMKVQLLQGVLSAEFQLKREREEGVRGEE